MLGLPGLPKKLPSRNWMIFLGITGAFTSAIIYDKREKKRATAKWARAVSHIANEPISSASEMPRRLTVLLASPPRDGLRIAQDHFVEYVKPILKASGLDWDFVQGRQQGDVRAAVAEKIRRARRKQERPDEAALSTEEDAIARVRKRNQIREWEGIEGDLVIGRHVWKEYIRGIHEGWLGPLDPPPKPELPVVEELADVVEGEKKPEEAKPTRPPQPVPYNTTADYAESTTPNSIPAEFSPVAPIQFPHVLGFSSTLTRLGRFLNRRKLADDIGREVAAACLAASREWNEDSDLGYEQKGVLEWEEKNWSKKVWKDDKPDPEEAAEPPLEKIWASDMVVDPSIAMRMRRFVLLPEDEARAARIVVPEEEVEGWIKGNLRHLGRWAIETWKGPPKPPVYTENEDDVV